MSSNHTLVSNREWQDLQNRIASTEAYVINREKEADRISRLIQSRQMESASIRRANQEAIQQSVNALTTMFNQNASRVRGGIDAQLRTRAGDFGAELQSMRSQLAGTSARLTQLDSKIDALATTYNDVFNEYIKQEQEASARAERVLAEVDRLLGLIDELEPARFSPNEYGALVSLCESIRANLGAGDVQAAIMVSQSSILRSTRLLARLQLLNEQYNSRLASIKENALRTQRRIEELSSKDGVLTAEIYGETKEIDYDISYWSHGEFDNLVSDFKHQQGLLNGKLTLEQLNQVDDNLNVLDENISRCDDKARRERTSALIAFETAESLYNSLTGSNWYLQDSGYASDDEREPYNMTYTDGAGNTVSIVVSPETPTAPGIFMEVFSENEALAENTKDSIHAMLENDGIEVGEREQRNDCHLNPDPETFTANAVAEAQENLRHRRRQL